MQKRIIVITGGPGTGKTTLINELSAQGHFCFPEISREISIEAKKKGTNYLFIEKPLLFSQFLLEGREKQYKNALLTLNDVVFLDRGIPDILAYMDFIDQKYTEEFIESAKVNRYSKVYILPPWKEIYTTDDVRYENFHESEIIHNHIVNTYKSLGYEPMEIPKGSIETRILYILNSLK